MVQLNLKKSLFTPKFFPYLTDYSHRWEMYMGSAGSSKSYFITQKLIVRAVNQPIRILVCRRYATTLRNTCFSLFKEILAKWKLTPYVKINESDFRIRFLHNGSEILFIGLDDETKLLSLNNIGAIFIEEAFEVPQAIVEQLNLRLRGKTENQQLILAWNPISKDSWLYNFSVVNPPENSIFIHSTYKDNPFLNAEYVAALEELYIRNPAKARIFCDGEWGINDEGLVLKNWITEEFNPMELAATGLQHRAGCDLGFVDKTAVIDTLYDAENRTIYVFNEFYKSGCQLDEVVEAIREMQLTKTKLYVDAAELRTIQFFRKEGLNAVASAKGRDSVRSGIEFLKNHKIIVHPSCKNFIHELENFSYIRSKQTGEFTNDTTHEFSHAIDACRYAYSDIYTNRQLKTLNKAALSL